MPRRLLLCATLSCLAFLAVALGLTHTARAQTAPAAAVVTPPTAVQLYEEGTKLLTRGRNFERAVAVLRQAAKQEPENSDFLLALGCAHASRASVLSRAIEAARKYAADTERYQTAKAKWTAAQKDPKSPAYGFAKPEPPTSPRTQDDNRLFKMEIAEAETLVRQFSLQAWQAVDKAVTLREKDTAERRAEARNTQGWCRILLYLDVRYAVKESWPPELKPKNDESKEGKQKTATPAEMAKMRETNAQVLFTPLREAAELQTDDASYLRSLGDAYATVGSHKHGTNPIFRTKGTDILEKVLEKMPSDVPIRLRISSLRGMHSLLGDISGPQSAVNMMKQAVQSDKNNAFLWYSLFAAAGDAHDYQTAMDALKAGGTAPTFRMMRYSVAAPKTLLWAFPPVSINPNRQLIQALHYVGHTVFADINNPTADAPRFEHEILVMASRHAKAFADASADWTDEERTALEKNLFWASSYATSQARLLKDTFPQTAEDTRLLAEAQRYITKNDAAIVAEQALGLRP